MKVRPVVPREQARRDVEDAVEHPDHIDVWRVLHRQRDIPAWMHEPEGK